MSGATQAPVSGRGRPFIVAAPSGTGKTTVCRLAVERDEALRFSVSHTTRTPREGERDGFDYHFVDRPAFERLVERDVFLEHAEFNDNLYGTSIEALEGPLSEGLDLIVEIEVQGARQLRDRGLPDACFVFLLPPSMEVLEARLRGRGTDSEETIARRLAISSSELEASSYFDYVIVNDDLDGAVDAFLEIVRSVRERKPERLARLQERYGRETAFARWRASQPTTAAAGAAR